MKGWTMIQNTMNGGLYSMILHDREEASVQGFRSTPNFFAQNILRVYLNLIPEFISRWIFLVFCLVNTKLENRPRFSNRIHIRRTRWQILNLCSWRRLLSSILELPQLRVRAVPSSNIRTLITALDFILNHWMPFCWRKSVNITEVNCTLAPRNGEGF